MATLAQVIEIATSFPDVTEGERYGNASWQVGTKVFAWERAYSKADLKRFGAETPPAQPIVAMAVADLAEKEAVLAEGTRGVFTIPHFDGYAAVLLEVKAITKRDLRRLLTDAWLACAPAKVAEAYLAPTRAGADDELPSIGAPATRALADAGITTLAQAATRTEAELLALHGVGPKATRILGEALTAEGLAFRTGGRA